MGSPVSVALSEIFMFLAEEQIFATCPDELKPLYYGRYIDDGIVITKNKAAFLNLVNHMNAENQQLPSLQFTMEEEQENQLPFLDILIKKVENRLNFLVYRKKTHSDHYCHPLSAIPHSAISATVTGMRLRAQKYCQNGNAYNQEIDHLQQALKKNNYNNRVIWPKLKPPAYARTVIIPFIGDLSYKIKRLLTHYNLRVLFKSPTKLGARLYKRIDWDRGDPLNNFDVVYRVLCQDCQAVYICR